MKRYVNMKEISDGRLYSLNDMVRADCGDCTGCSACCHGMGSSIVLDPYDIWRLTEGLGVSLPELMLTGKVEMNMVDGVTLPDLKMQEKTEACAFLNEEGRCSIHAFRPGICRLFPLGRYYEEGSFRYFLQIHECQKESRSKVKVWKWIDTPDARRYDQYITDWHFHLAELQGQVKEELLRPGTAGEQRAGNINMDLIQRFFLQPYEKDRDFYSQFYERLEASRLKWADQQTDG